MSRGIGHSHAGEAFTRLVLATFRLNGRLIETGDRLTRPLGLTSARWQVLGPLESGALTVSQIARAMGLRRQSVQRLIDVLRANGFVALAANPAHRRASLVALTQRGRSVVAKLNRLQVEWANRLVAGLPPRDIEAAVRVLDAFSARLTTRKPGRRSRP